jgi:hypothetical protein
MLSVETAVVRVALLVKVGGYLDLIHATGCRHPRLRCFIGVANIFNLRCIV